MPSRSHQIRNATVADAAAIQAIYAPIVGSTAISFEDAAPTVDAMAGRIAETLVAYPYLVGEQSGQVVGYAYAGPHRARDAYRRSVDVSGYVAEGARGAGLGKALYTDLFAALARQEFHAAFAGIALPNAASVGFHESMGFELVGVYREVGFKLGRWHDVGWWQRLVSPH